MWLLASCPSPPHLPHTAPWPPRCTDTGTVCSQEDRPGEGAHKAAGHGLWGPGTPSSMGGLQAGSSVLLAVDHTLWAGEQQDGARVGSLEERDSVQRPGRRGFGTVLSDTACGPRCFWSQLSIQPSSSLSPIASCCGWSEWGQERQLVSLNPALHPKSSNLSPSPALFLPRLGGVGKDGAAGPAERWLAMLQ